MQVLQDKLGVLSDGTEGMWASLCRVLFWGRGHLGEWESGRVGRSGWMEVTKCAYMSVCWCPEAGG